MAKANPTLTFMSAHQGISANTVVLVIGATGALGQAMVAHLLHHTGCQIVATGRSSPPATLLRDNCRLTFQHCHLDSAMDIVRMLTAVKPDMVLHLAATFDDDISQAQQINYQAAATILGWVASHRNVTRVLLVGSAAEYGVVSVDDNPVSETRQLRPVSVYGHSKACQSQLVTYFASRGVSVVLGRIFNLIGEGLSTRLFIGKVHAQIAEVKLGQRVKIEVGSLSACRDYLPLDGAITQLITIACQGLAGETYHVASGHPVTMRDLLSQELVKNGLDFSCVVESPALSNRIGYDVPIIYADMAKTNALMSQMSQHA